jgi:hypothetical protein
MAASSTYLSFHTSAQRASRLRQTFVWLNALGGVAVIGSYVYGVATAPDPGAAWGGVPDGLRSLYVVSMGLAALGYFAMTSFVLFGADPARTRLGPFGWGLFPLLYALLLIPSALWMPLTFAHLAAPSAGLWIAVRAVLGLVGLGSLGVLASIAALRPATRRWHWRLALAGALAFCFQTAVLDASVWPHYFPRLF